MSLQDSLKASNIYETLRSAHGMQRADIPFHAAPGFLDSFLEHTERARDVSNFQLVTLHRMIEVCANTVENTFKNDERDHGAHHHFTNFDIADSDFLQSARASIDGIARNVQKVVSIHDVEQPKILFRALNREIEDDVAMYDALQDGKIYSKDYSKLAASRRLFTLPELSRFILECFASMEKDRDGVSTRLVIQRSINLLLDHLRNIVQMSGFDVPQLHKKPEKVAQPNALVNPIMVHQSQTYLPSIVKILYSLFKRLFARKSAYMELATVVSARLDILDVGFPQESADMYLYANDIVEKIEGDAAITAELQRTVAVDFRSLLDDFRHETRRNVALKTWEEIHALLGPLFEIIGTLETLSNIGAVL